MQAYRILPTKALSVYVKSIGLINAGEKGAPPSGARILPDAYFELTLRWRGGNMAFFNRDQECIVAGADQLFFGLFTSGARIQYPTDMELIEVKFWPWAMHALTRYPMGEMHNKIVDASQVFGTGIQYLQKRIEAVSSFEAVVELVEHFLLSLLDQKIPAFNLLRYGTLPFYHSHGMDSVEQALKPLGVTRRTLERQYKKHYGISPKQFARNLRVRRLAKLFSEQPGVRFTRLSYQCGYCDQSHMIKEFKALTGTAPTTYFQSSPYLAPFYPDE